MGTPVACFADCSKTASDFIDSSACHNPYRAKLTGSDENTGWTRLTGRVTFAINMALSDAALIGVIVATVLLCLALDRFIGKRREARAKDSSDDSPLVR
jgi:hypothetical protein